MHPRRVRDWTDYGPVWYLVEGSSYDNGTVMMEKAKIHIVDDDQGLRTLMKFRLEAAGYQVMLAGGGGEALAQIAKEVPELAIVDLRMEGMDGLTLLDRLHSVHADLPVIILTAHGTIDSAVEATRKGAYDYLTKPFDPKDLLRRIEKALELRRLRGEVERLHQQAEAQLREEAQISAALARVGQELISSLETPTILDRLCQLTTEVLSCDSSYTFFWRPEQAAYVLVAGWGDITEHVEASQELEIPAEVIADLVADLERENVVQVHPAASQPLLPGVLLRLLRVSGALCVALRRGEEIIGVQIAGYRDRTEPFTTSQQRIAQGTSQIASLALVNARLLEGLEQANRLKSDFLATMSHELRTPLNIIMGYTQIVLDDTEEQTGNGFAAEHVRMLQRVDRSARELLDLITALLDVSRLEAGQRPLDVREILLQELLGEIEAETDELLRGKPGLHLVWSVKAALPPLHTDRAKLKVVLKNLVGNAVKFTEQGQVTIEVSVNNGEVEFCVMDTGVGIAPEVLPVIFEMFRQGDSSATRRHEGVGLGLYIVKQLVGLLGGRIEVESEVGHGSTFRVWIPTITEPAK